MAREQAKYPSPRDPGDDRGYGPSWRDVSEALRRSKALFGHEHSFSLWDGDSAKNPQPGVVFTLHCHFKECPVHSLIGPGVLWHRYPSKDFKTVPAMLLDIIERVDEMREGYLAQQQLPIFSEPKG